MRLYHSAATGREVLRFGPSALALNCSASAESWGAEASERELADAAVQPSGQRDTTGVLIKNAVQGMMQHQWNGNLVGLTVVPRSGLRTLR